MKICEFCETLNQDDAVVCPSCGGNSFKEKCNNCGTVFENAAYCPRCGVKAGQQAKKCPYCKTDYFTNACPTCGYLPGRTTTVVEREPAAKKRHTVLWVLGWIFMMPVPITILTVRSKKLKNWMKVCIIAAVWFLYLMIAGLNSSEDAESTQSPDIQEVTVTHNINIDESIDASIPMDALKIK